MKHTYRVGDVIQIVSSWGGKVGQNLDGEMNYMLGNTYTISGVGPWYSRYGQAYSVEGHPWVIFEGMIASSNSVGNNTGSKKLFMSYHAAKKIRDLTDNNSFFVTHESGDILSVKTDKTFGSTFEKPLVIGREGNLFLRGRENNKIKLGKILGALYPDFTATEIETYVSAWKKKYTINLGNVQVSSDIKAIYNASHPSNGDLGGSCMRYKGELMKPYEALGCKIVYMLDNDGVLLARAILWEELEDTKGNKLKAIDRIFATDENSKLHLQQWSDDNGYYDIKKNKDDISVHTVKTLQGCYFDDGVPYIDTMYQLDSKYRLTNYSDYYGLLQNTNGTYEYSGGDELCGINNCECVHCGATSHEDESYYSDFHEGYLCYDCSIWSEVMRDYIIYDEAVRYDTNSDYVHEDRADFNDIYLCYVRDEYYSIDNLVYCEDIGDYVHGDEDYSWVEDIGEYHHNADDLYYCEYEGTYWSSEEAYTEHLEN
jgi:hypothetical protein